MRPGEVPLEALASRYADDSDEEGVAPVRQQPPQEAPAAGDTAATAAAAAPAASDAAAQPEQAAGGSGEEWSEEDDEEDDWDSDDDDLASALEWADLREGELQVSTLAAAAPVAATLGSAPALCLLLAVLATLQSGLSHIAPPCLQCTRRGGTQPRADSRSGRTAQTRTAAPSTAAPPRCCQRQATWGAWTRASAAARCS